MKADLTKLRLAAILGFLAIALGAMGAHGLEKHWDATLDAAAAARRVEVWKTGSFYHMVHAIVLLILAFAFPDPRSARGSTWCYLLGILLFSGSLYAYCLTGIGTIARVTPFGGVLLMVGWFLLLFQKPKQV